MASLKNVAIVFFLSVAALVAGPIGDPPLTGQRDASADIFGTNGWFDDFTVTWAITPEGQYLRYTYTFDTGATGKGEPSMSHWLLELSTNCWTGATASSSTCMFNPTLNDVAISLEDDIEFKTHLAGSAGNPGLPADIFGVKFDIGWEFEDGPAVYSFLSDRQPMWGNFYVKGGQVYAYNQGLHPDNAGSTNVNLFIAVPNTKTVDPIPEPGSIALFGAGMVALGYLHRRRLQRKQ